ncbi:MAG: glycosyltransferase [Chloroflexota bacterium]
MSKIALFIPNLGGGGAERFMVNFSRGLVELGYPVDLVLCEPTGQYMPQVPSQVNIVNLATGRVLTSARPLAAYLRREQPTALLATLEHAALSAIWARMLARSHTHLTIRIATTLSQHIPLSPHWQDKLLPLLVPLFFRRADAIIANASTAADDLAHMARISRQRVTVIPNPVDAAYIRQQASKPAEHSFLSDKIPLILGVGRLLPSKDFSTLVQAFAQVRARRPARLIILGEGSERPHLEALVESLNIGQDVALPGFVENPYAFMKRSAVFALSSRVEGMPNVLLEAIACGCPVVATDAPGGSAMVLDGGRVGPLVPVGDAAALATAIQGLLDKPTPAETLAARAQDFDLMTISRRYLRTMGIAPGDTPNTGA